ncbi:soma ferritin-like isoform X2 [Watersipora subatra]|uniref:soma ferritin-like isoform X2 n=1 Tax=Watersipora subatra TaxID=2589382 RepID=UPI00355C383E
MLAKIFIFAASALLVLGSEHVLPSNDCENIESKVCQNFDEERESAINQQINMELEASYAYLAMAAYFSREDPNRMGFAKFFFAASAEERQHALKLIEYQNLRGGEVKLTAIRAPSNADHVFRSGLEAVTKALALERRVNAAILNLHELCKNDPQMQDFLEGNYLQEQVDSIRELAGMVSQLTKLHETNPGLGEHIFDEKLQH